MLNRDEEAMSACSVVTRLSPDGSGTLENVVAGAGFEPATFGL